MRRYALSLALIGALLLSGCNSSYSPSISSETAPALDITESSSAALTTDTAPIEDVPVAEDTPSIESNNPETSAETNAPAVEAPSSGTIKLVGLIGDTITDSDKPTINSEGGLTSLSQLTKDNWYGVLCEGFCYLAEPSEPCYDSIENADIYNAEDWTFDGVPKISGGEYKRYNVGDEICGLTIKYATTSFTTNNIGNIMMEDGTTVRSDELGIEEIYFSGCTVTFDGTAVIEGYLNITPEDEYGIDEGAIFFVPAAAEKGTLPVCHYALDYQNGIHIPQYIGGTEYVKYSSEYPTNFILGNKNTTEADVSQIPVSATEYVKARVTIENISMSSDIDWLSRIRADIVDIELI